MKVGEYVDTVGPVIRIVVEGPNGTETVEARLDTGFYGMLTLPALTVDILGLTFSHTVEVTLADGQIRRLDVHRARVDWLGTSVPIFVHAIPPSPGTNRLPLLGLQMLNGRAITVEVISQGDVTVEEIR